MERNKKLLTVYGVGSAVCAVLAAYLLSRGLTGAAVLLSVPIFMAFGLTVFPPKAARIKKSGD